MVKNIRISIAKHDTEKVFHAKIFHCRTKPGVEVNLVNFEYPVLKSHCLLIFITVFSSMRHSRGKAGKIEISILRRLLVDSLSGIREGKI